MSPTQKKRFTVVALILLGTSLATFLALKAVDANAEFFITPSEIHAGDFKTEQRYRIAGLVKKDSLSRQDDGVTREFLITDCEHDVRVQYKGLLPDLFREGQAIVAKGIFETGDRMIADQVLAKHDENYVPSEAAETMMQAQANKCDTVDGPVDL